MRISIEQGSFEPPEGFQDGTNYTFSDRLERESLQVTFGIRPPEAEDLQALLVMRLGNVHQVLQGATPMGNETNVPVDGLQGRMASYTFPDRGAVFCARAAVAFLTKAQYVQITYTAPVADDKAEARFRQVLLSVVAAKQTPTEPTPAGFVRRWARRLSLDVPVTLRQPLSYVFALPDESARLVLTCTDPKDPESHLPSLADEIAGDAATGVTVGEQTQKSVTAGGAQASLISYPLISGAPSGRASVAVCRAHVVIRGGATVHLCGRKQGGTQEDADALVENFVRGLKPSN